jgi:hypothetical protein
VNWYFSQKPPRYDAAELQARTLVSLDVHRLGGYRALAVIDAAAVRWPELDAVLADAERVVPDDFGAHYAAARTITTQGNDFPRAERYLRKYVGQEPEAGEPTLALARWRLGQTLEKEGKRRAARGAAAGTYGASACWLMTIEAGLSRSHRSVPRAGEKEGERGRPFEHGARGGARAVPALLNDDLALPLRVAEEHVIVVPAGLRCIEIARLVGLPGRHEAD